jgi:hypothetical protein
MKYSQPTFENYEITSRIIFGLVIILLLCAGIFSAINVLWLNWLSSIAFVFVQILLIVSWITPGFLVVLGRPWLAQAWLRGINTILIPSTPWEILPISKKIMVYFYSLSISAFVIFAVIAFVMNSRYLK